MNLFISIFNLNLYRSLSGYFRDKSSSLQGFGSLLKLSSKWKCLINCFFTTFSSTWIYAIRTPLKVGNSDLIKSGIKIVFISLLQATSSGVNHIELFNIRYNYFSLLRLQNSIGLYILSNYLFQQIYKQIITE